MRADGSGLARAIAAALVLLSEAPGRRAEPRPPRRLPVAPHPTVRAGRNDPCPCGSGKKFKRCCHAIGGR
jgi:uncharacterized protein